MKKRILQPCDRLIVAADFKPEGKGRKWVKEQNIALAELLKTTGVYFKSNSGLRALGYDFGDEIHDRGLRLFADGKLNDIPRTLETDGELLRELDPELVTVMCLTGRDSMHALEAALPNSEILGVTVLTSLEVIEVGKMLRCAEILDNVTSLAWFAKEAGLDGIVCAPKEAAAVRVVVGPGMTIVTPAVRPLWSVVEDDDQNPDRVMTPTKAFAAGADRIVVGSPIVGSKNPYDAVMRTLDEIASATV